MSTPVDPQVYLREDVTLNRLAALSKEDLIRLARFLDVGVPEGLNLEGASKPALKKLILMHSSETVMVAEENRAIERERRALEKEKNDLERQRQSLEGVFNLTKALPMVPKFDAAQVEAFFEIFERLAAQRKWPYESWVTLIAPNLTGEAQKAYVNLEQPDGEDYAAVKAAILRTYELVPEAYRQRFRDIKPAKEQTYTGFARQQHDACMKWLRASNVTTYDQLVELIRLEQFKISMPKAIQTHLNDARVSTVRDAAEMADHYVLVHKEVLRPKFEVTRTESQPELNQGSWRPTFEVTRTESQPELNQGSWRSNQDNWSNDTGWQRNRSSSLPFIKRVCHNCGKSGHLKANCRQPSPSRRSPRVLPLPGTPHPSACMASTPAHSLDNIRKADGREDFSGFISEGSVAIEENGLESPLVVVRDTCSRTSVLVAGTVDLPESTKTGTYVSVLGFGGEPTPLPLYRVYLRTNIFRGYATVAVAPAENLPMEGVTFLLANDLAGTTVVVTPHLSQSPINNEETQKLEKNLASLNGDNGNLKEQIRTLEEEKSALSGQIDSLKGEVLNKCMELEEKGRQYEELQAQMVEAGQKHSKDLENVAIQVARLEDQVKELEGRLQQESGRAERAEKSHADLLEQYQTACDLALSKDSVIELGQAEVCQLRESLSQSTAQQDQLQARLAEEKSALQVECEERVAAKAEEAEQAKLSLVKIQQEIPLLQDQISSLESTLKYQKGLGAELQAKHDVLVEKQGELEEHIVQLETIRDGLQRDLSEQVNTAGELKERCDTLIASDQEKAEALEKMSDTLTNTEKDLQTVQAKAEILEAQLSSAESKASNLEKQNTELSEKIAEVQKEALGLVLAVKHFEVYVSQGGREVEVLTDHNPLAFLARYQTANNRVFRWALVLQPYNLVVRHVAGKNNILADTLSRMPVGEET